MEHMTSQNLVPRPKPTGKQHSLNDYDLMECIDEGLGKFGPGIKYAIMWRMIVLGDSPKEGILANPQAFVTALHSIFGRSAEMVEREVVGRIKARADKDYATIESLVELVQALRKQDHNLCDLAVVE